MFLVDLGLCLFLLLTPVGDIVMVDNVWLNEIICSMFVLRSLWLIPRLWVSL